MKMEWYKIRLTSDQVSKNQGTKLLDELEEIYEEEDEPEDLAIFSENNETGGITYYFPPSSVKYALILFSFYRGTKCVAPRFEEVSLALGDSDAKERFIKK